MALFPTIVRRLVKRKCEGKNTDVHKATVAGDTVGDPLKDTSGPALNIVMKLMARSAQIKKSLSRLVLCGAHS